MMVALPNISDAQSFFCLGNTATVLFEIVGL